MVPPQRANTSVPQQNAAMALFIDTRSTVSPPNTRDDITLQPPSSDLDFDAINGQLLTICKTIEDTRTKIWSKRVATEQERTLRLQCSDAYKRLHAHYGKALQDLRDTSSNSVSLQRQLGEARGVISTYESTIEDYERRLSNHTNLVQMAEHEAARATQLESNIRQLKEEKADIAQKLYNAQECQVAFSNTSDCLGGAEQKISELEKEKKGMVTDHQFAVATAAYRISERQRLDEAPHKDGPATRGRKRRVAVQNGGDSDAVRL